MIVHFKTDIHDKHDCKSHAIMSNECVLWLDTLVLLGCSTCSWYTVRHSLL